ncbi:amino acid adenylation domain-containing protein [Streptomyces monticola]|uniref:Amino acid adenylation domain-containing protein n=1 Tax=Streptomyces monticola TaxID=2666263 RepID=A0ABW2JYV1_9ACTN
MNSAELVGELPGQFKPGAVPLTLEAIFKRVVERFPESVAVVDGRTRLTYRELDRRSDRLAQVLRVAGAGRDQRVGLCTERSTELVVGLLGILKAGAGYVPVDPSYPADRREYILDSSDATLVVADAASAGLIASRTVIPVDARPEDSRPDDAAAVPPQPDDAGLAYIIFTSGSSGQPKGVMIEHRNAVRLFTTTHPLFGFDENDVWCNFHSASFDFSVWEIWGALLFGGRLVMVDKETARDPKAFLELLGRERVTVLNQTPSAFRNLAAAEAQSAVELPALRYVVFGGERLDHRALAPWAERHGLDRPALINMYGITETTVHVTWQRITAADLTTDGPSPIGAPLPDLKVEIVDEAGRALPIGAEGRIQVAGPGLARGYLGDPRLTAERFPHRPGDERTGDHGSGDQGTTTRWYDSGDLGVQTSPGQYAYAGRADRQLKVRGYRIEPGEIESRIARHPDVRECVVGSADFAAGDPRLVAYVVPGTDPGDGKELTARLREHTAAALPGHMTPSAYVFIDAIPLTMNGKLDQEALDKLFKAKRPGRPAAATEAAASVEDELRTIWAGLLDTADAADIGDGDDFFDLGGTSFSLVQMVNQVNAHFQLSLKVGVLSRGATVAALADAVRNTVKEKQDD